MKYHYYALFSGCLGATASCCAKLAFDTNSNTSNMNTTDSAVSPFLTTVCNDWFGFQKHSRKDGHPEPSTTMLMSVKQILTWNNTDSYQVCYVSLFLLHRGLYLLGMILCNVCMIGTYLEGMQESGTIAGVALSTSSNFILSAIYGYAIWNERYTTHWWIGFLMVCFGMTILTQFCSTNSTGNNSATTSKKQR
jgi:drug/metabolite transporter (DMT)-like permease